MGRHKGFIEEDYRKLSLLGYSMSEAAYLMGVTRQTVSAMARRYGITFANGNTRRMMSNPSSVHRTEAQGSYMPERYRADGPGKVS